MPRTNLLPQSDGNATDLAQLFLVKAFREFCTCHPMNLPEGITCRFDGHKHVTHIVCRQLTMLSHICSYDDPWW